VFQTSDTIVSEWMCVNWDEWSIRLLRYLKGGLACVP